jgi:hypothetical protein
MDRLKLFLLMVDMMLLGVNIILELAKYRRGK